MDGRATTRPSAECSDRLGHRHGTVVFPLHRDTVNAAVLTGHHGVDLQWRRTRSTWYGQARFAPWTGPDQENASESQWLIGHVRHGEGWTVWTEFTPANSSALPEFDPASPGGGLGVRYLSSLQPDWVQGIEWRPAGVTVSAELGRLRDAWSGKMTLSLPPMGIDSALSAKRLGRKSAGRTGTSRLWFRSRHSSKS